MSTDKQQPMAKIVLGAAHSHAGTDYAKGDLIEVSGKQAAWLIKNHGAHTASAAEIKQHEQEQANDE